MRHGRSLGRAIAAARSVTSNGMLEVNSNNSARRVPDEFRNDVHTERIFHLKIDLTKIFSAGLEQAIAAARSITPIGMLEVDSGNYTPRAPNEV